MRVVPFGERLRQLRVAVPLTQGELAGRVGVTRESVVRWENGHRYPAWDVVVKLAKALNVRPRDFDVAI